MKAGLRRGPGCLRTARLDSSASGLTFLRQPSPALLLSSPGPAAPNAADGPDPTPNPSASRPAATHRRGARSARSPSPEPLAAPGAAAGGSGGAELVHAWFARSLWSPVGVPPPSGSRRSSRRAARSRPSRSASRRPPARGRSARSGPPPAGLLVLSRPAVPAGRRRCARSARCARPTSRAAVPGSGVAGPVPRGSLSASLRCSQSPLVECPTLTCSAPRGGLGSSRAVQRPSASSPPPPAPPLWARCCPAGRGAPGLPRCAGLWGVCGGSLRVCVGGSGAWAPVLGSAGCVVRALRFGPGCGAASAVSAVALRLVRGPGAAPVGPVGGAGAGAGLRPRPGPVGGPRAPGPGGHRLSPLPLPVPLALVAARLPGAVPGGAPAPAGPPGPLRGAHPDPPFVSSPPLTERGPAR
jgi:hypothetical protein